jgi:hypothetical protein
MTAIFSYAAIGLLVAGAAVASSGDYMLVMPEGGVATGTKSKSLQMCQEAREAAWAGRLPNIPAGTPSRCEPAPGAFSARSNCIQNYNCR